MSAPLTRGLVLALALVLAGTGCGREPAEAPRARAPSLPAQEAPASAQAAVLASMDRFLAARSFHATLDMTGPHPLRSELEFVAPDRYRLAMPVGTQLIIGDTLYLDRDGKRQRMPLPPGALAQWRNPLQLDERREGLRVQALGTERLRGQRARKYRIDHAEAGKPGLLYWIDAQGRPLRIVQQGRTQGQPFALTIDYSRFDDPSIRIEAP